MNNANFARIMLNGKLGEKIQLYRGVRQGDPASGYIFNVAMDVLARLVLRSSNIRGVQISPGVEPRISQYADDATLYIDGTASSMTGLFKELQRFSMASGLNLNQTKTKCLAIGEAKKDEVDPEGRYSWVSELKILGITFSNQ